MLKLLFLTPSLTGGFVLLKHQKESRSCTEVQDRLLVGRWAIRGSDSFQQAAVWHPLGDAFLIQPCADERSIAEPCMPCVLAHGNGGSPHCDDINRSSHETFFRLLLPAHRQQGCSHSLSWEYSGGNCRLADLIFQ